MTAAPPCNPDNLGDVCAGGCGRRLHIDGRRNRSRRQCAEGHPTRDSYGCCTACAKHVATSPVCTHDEGEPCDCETTT